MPDSPLDLSHKQFVDHDFSDVDLTGAKTFNASFTRCTFKKFSQANTQPDGALRPVSAQFHHCIFDDGDIAFSNFYKSDFLGSSFRRTNMYETVMVKCRMPHMVFEPKDAFGIAFSFTCHTFQHGVISPFWYLSWFILANSMTMMQHAGYPSDMQARIIDAIGAERFAKLKTLFNREL